MSEPYPRTARWRANGRGFARCTQMYGGLAGAHHTYTVQRTEALYVR
jgi:hypothetical protein